MLSNTADRERLFISFHVIVFTLYYVAHFVLRGIRLLSKEAYMYMIIMI